jgi:Fe-S cluster biogenesis protein NfuA
MPEATPVTISSAVTADGAIDLGKLTETLEYIRPAIQADGGDLVLLGTDGGTVNLQMVGACGGCPLSMMTLKAGIERILIDRVPGVEEVNASADAPSLDDPHLHNGIELPAL